MQFIVAYRWLAWVILSCVCGAAFLGGCYTSYSLCDGCECSCRWGLCRQCGFGFFYVYFVGWGLGFVNFAVCVDVR